MSHQGGYRNLKVWQKAMDLARAVYVLTENFPKSEQYGLISQMRRSAVSIPSNIAEGSKRNTDKDFLQFLSIALGSVAELDTQIELARTLTIGKKLDYSGVDKPLEEVNKMLTAFVIKLKTNS